ncbi:YcaO-like family protein [Actinomadura chokoriensis]|uniref:YcaO-like family protein n=1 Tax=Actinomadura chokoriensis TaxID=454156 RepID=A0ABV4QZ91_9ACTN
MRDLFTTGWKVPVLSSSFRTAPAAETARRAWEVARRLGVTRCADATWLDRVGIPVYSATRPDAAAVIVTAGKGGTSDEARAGALMEAVELAVAERSAAEADRRGDLVRLTAREAVDRGSPSVGSLCPVLGRKVDPDQEFAWVRTAEAISGGDFLVPAELVFHPCPPQLAAGLWGSTTTGLASGNSPDEAVLHGLCEVIERDALSFETVRSDSLLVRPAQLPAVPAMMMERIQDAGLKVWLRLVPTPLGPCFSSLVADDDLASPLACNGGYGFHPVAAIAAARALCEAAQSRLTYIQGARDDLEVTVEFIDSFTAEKRRAYRDELVAGFARDDEAIDFADIPTAQASSIAELLADLLERCRANGFDRVGVYRYPALARPFTVVRVTVPFAEHFTQATRRVGVRLAEMADMVLDEST